MLMDVSELWVVVPTTRRYDPELDTEVFTDYDIAIVDAFDRYNRDVEEYEKAKKELWVDRISATGLYKVITLREAISDYVQNVRDDCYDDAYSEGYAEGKREGADENFEEGYSEGKKIGYEEGYEDGQASVNK